MIEWLRKHFEQIEISWFKVKLRQPSAAPRFDGFSKWKEVRGVVSGASRTQVKLNRLPGITREDWELLSELSFYQMAQGEKTITFGYKTNELPKAYVGPLRRWTAHAMLVEGQGERVQGDITCVNVANETLSVVKLADDRS